MIETRRHRMPFGAELDGDRRVRFRLWAPDASDVQLSVVAERAAESRLMPMTAEPGGWFSMTTAGSLGMLYHYRIDGARDVPDPASRFQPQGVHGPSEVVDPAAYEWADGAWTGRPWQEAVLYELHVGTFTSPGSFESTASRLPYLRELGITAIELMPVAAFAGNRNWGYDGVLPFAPQVTYGRPEQLKALIDAAHAHGIMVLLDVVYNHFGPEGNYLHCYAGDFFTDRHHTPWGRAVNFDGRNSRIVRDFFIHNALYWLDEFHVDGLRLDAVHAIADDSSPDILEEIADTVARGPGRHRFVHLVLENDRNQAHYLRRRGKSGSAPGFYAAQWNDDFHHACHTLLTGETDGYYADYADRPLDHLGRCLREGFAYQGEASGYRGGAKRGESCEGVPLSAFIDFLQNHDQVGNRAHGERLTALVPAHALHAAVSLMLLGPAVPGVFMGEEFGCRQPFLYFADFGGDLKEAVRAGRQAEFASFERFAGGDEGSQIPDPMAEETFARSTLQWKVLDAGEHAEWLSYYRTLIDLRRRFITPRLPAVALDAPIRIGATGLITAWRLSDGARLVLHANLGARPVTIEPSRQAGGRLLHAEPATAAGSSSLLPSWSALWHLEESEGDAGSESGNGGPGRSVDAKASSE